MTPSIRKFLLFNLLLSVTLSTSLTAIGNLFLDHKDIEKHLDSQLVQAALAIQAFVSIHPGKDYLKNLQEQFHMFHEQTNNDQVRKSLGNYQSWAKQILQFQILNAKGEVVVHTKRLTDKPLASLETGFSKVTIHGNPWRIFTLINPKTHYAVVVVQQYETWGKLEQKITQDDIYIALLTYPLLGLLIWIIVGKGLNPLRRVASEVSHRAPSYLEPVSMQSVPIEIKPLVDELNRLFERLQQAFDREKRFAADAAHELRTPLAALKTQTQVALHAETEQERRKSLENVLAGVDRATHVVQQLLTLSRLVPEATLENITRVNLCNLLTEMIAQLAPHAVDKDIDIELIAEERHITVDANATALSILVRNLIDNAIRYTPEGGCVTAIIERTKDNVLLKVRDTGPGIPDELRARVFERFFRILGNKSPGSGLGLAIVQQIAGHHKAKVVLATPPDGKGLQVEIHFPHWIYHDEENEEHLQP